MSSLSLFQRTDASRPTSRSGPSSDSLRSVNHERGSRHDVHTTSSSSASRKRKVDDELPSETSKKRRPEGLHHPMEELLKPTIAIKPHPPNVLVKSQALLPLMLLPRENLPLSSLDFSCPYGDFAAGRSFESRIRIMELEGRLGSNVLIARSDSNASVYAIERESTGLYVLCKLGSWVDLERLSDNAMVVCRQRIRPSTSRVNTIGTSEPPLVTPQVHRENKRRRLAIEEIQSKVRKPPKATPILAAATPAQEECPIQLPTPLTEDPRHSSNNELGVDLTQRSTTTAGPSTLPPPRTPAKGEALVEQATATVIFDNIRTQYFEALYRSMGSLAYFAKGPLSRARAAFHLDCDSNLEMKDLVDFLRDMVMTTSVVDKKYRETIPELIADMKTRVDSSDNGEAKAKKRKAKKMKLGKNGLYPTEDSHIRKWWTANKPDLPDEEVAVKPEGVRYHVSCLRMRETQLQMILILEILALEALRPPEDAGESQLPGLDIGAATSAPEPAKKRKKQDLRTLLDIHADRLCIWQTTITDDVIALGESQRIDGDLGKPERANSDPLKDFCVDIILPFFSARLPDLCNSLNQKFRGPVIVSPPNKKASQPSAPSGQPRQKPGGVTKRPALPKAAKSLDRVLSNERMRRSVSRGPNDAIAQMRSATAAPVPGLKREMSEPRSLSGIARRASATLKERPVNSLARSLSVSSSDDLRAKKKALVEAELQDAISALKKPNRELAGKAIMEAAERRLFAGPTYIRKSKKPVHNPIVEKIQVKATPASNRFRDLFPTKPQEGGGTLPVINEPDFVPSSGPRRGQTRLPTSPRIANTPVAGRVQSTLPRPSAVPSRFLKPPVPEDFVPTSSPLQPGKGMQTTTTAAAGDFAGHVRPVGDFVPTSSPILRRTSSTVGRLPHTTGTPLRSQDTSSPGIATLFETPVKARTKPAAPQENVSVPVKKLTIFQQLGWDDTDIDDL